MRLVTFVPPDGRPRAGVLLADAVIDLAIAAPLVIEELPELRWDLLSLLRADQDEVNLDVAADIVAAVAGIAGADLYDDGEVFGSSHLEGSLSIGGEALLLPLEQVRLLAPLPRPTSLRHFAVFEQAAAATYAQGLPSEWYRLPAFAFGNHMAIYGPGEIVPMPRTDALDYSFELACVIGHAGRDIPVDTAADYIAGYTILNSWAARDLEALERPLGRGVKGRDFAVSLGPYLVTPDELEIYADDDGRLSLTLTARVNGRERSRANTAAMYFTFAEMIAYASRDTTLHPGDVLSSGPVPTGSLAELTQGYGPWLDQGDQVELEITELGMLLNTVE